MLNLKPEKCLTEEEISKGLNYLLLDGIFSQSMNSLASGAFLIAYALLFHATNLVIGLLAAIPFLSNLMQLVSTFLIEKYHRRKIISVLSSTISRVSLFFIALTPLIFKNYELLALLVLLLIMNIFGALSNGAFNSWMKDFVPEKIRGQYFAKRTRISLFIATIMGILAALYIDNLIPLFQDISIYLKYNSLFLFAFVLGIVGISFLSRIPEPAMSDNERWHISLLTKPFRDNKFRKLLIFTAVWSFSYNLVAPFFIVYMYVRLFFPITFVIAITAISQFMNIALLPTWGYLIDRFGVKPVMKLSATFFLIAMGLWPYTTLPDKYFLTIPIVFAVYFLVGLATGGIQLSSTIFAFKLSPKKGATAYITTNGTIISIAAGISPIFSGAIIDFLEKMRLSLTFSWTGSKTPLTIFLTDFQGLDFIFLIGLVFGFYSLYLLKDVPEDNVADYSKVKEEFIYSIRRSVKTQFLVIPSVIPKHNGRRKHKFFSSKSSSTIRRDNIESPRPITFGINERLRPQ